METTHPITPIIRAPLSVTVNIDKLTPHEVKQWTINTIPELGAEPSRISVQRLTRYYSLVMKDVPEVEVWDIDENGELGKLLYTIPIEPPCS